MKEKEFNLINLTKLIWKKKKTVFFVVFITSVISLGISFMLPKWFKASAVIITESNNGGSSLSSLAGQFGLQGMLGGVAGEQEQLRYVMLLKSAKLQRKIIKKFNLQEKYEINTMVQTIAKFQDNFDVKIGDEMQLVISIIDKDQNLVAEMVDYTLEVLDSVNISLSQNSAKNRKIFIGKQLEGISDTLKYFEGELVALMEKEKVFSLPEQVTAQIENSALLKSQILLNEIELKTLRESVRHDDPRIVFLENKLEILKGEFKETIESKNKSYLSLDLNKVPKTSVRLEIIKRKIEFFSTLLQYIGPQYEQARIDELKEIPTFQILDEPIRPELKYKPKKAYIILFSAFMSFFISVLLLIYKENY